MLHSLIKGYTLARSSLQNNMSSLVDTSDFSGISALDWNSSSCHSLKSDHLLFLSPFLSQFILRIWSIFSPSLLEGCVSGKLISGSLEPLWSKSRHFPFELKSLKGSFVSKCSDSNASFHSPRVLLKKKEKKIVIPNTMYSCFIPSFTFLSVPTQPDLVFLSHWNYQLFQKGAWGVSGS